VSGYPATIAGWGAGALLHQENPDSSGWVKEN